VAEGDFVAVYWRGRGTNTGEGNWLPATGEAIDVTGFTLLKIVDGLILEEWNVADQLSMYRQLGLSSPQKKPVNP
jgi:predicted ester cyclase